MGTLPAATVSVEEIAARCVELNSYATRVEERVRMRSIDTIQQSLDLISILGEARNRLYAIYAFRSAPGSAGPWWADIRSLITRYRDLEGCLKEIRNDMMQEIRES